MRFVVEGPPTTKKNSQRIFRSRSGRPFVVQSARAVSWEQSAVLQLRSQSRGQTFDASVRAWNLRALIYRAQNRGDLVNYLEAVCDALERAGMIENDRMILGLDGSRLMLDRKRPRVEIDLEPM